VAKIKAEIERLSATEVARLTKRLSENQVQFVNAAEQLLDSGNYVYYRNLSKAISGGADADARSIIESNTFEDFIQKAGLALVVRDPFPNPIPGSPAARILLFESHHARPTPAYSVQDTASYAVLSDKRVVMDSTARELFTHMHEDLLAAISSGSESAAATNTSA